MPSQFSLFKLIFFFGATLVLLNACTVKLPSLNMGCNSSNRQLAAAVPLVKVQMEVAPVCPEAPMCFYDVYSNENGNFPDLNIRGYNFKAAVEIVSENVPESVSTDSMSADARCYDSSNGKWISGEPLAVLQKLNCI